MSHFSSAYCSEAMAKRTQKDSGEERVIAKSRPMMSLIARAPSTLSSSASENQGKKSYRNQCPWSAKAEKDDRKSTVTCTQHVTQGEMMRKLGLLKSGKLMNRWMIERGNPL